jgi:hypothetical protein
VTIVPFPAPSSSAETLAAKIAHIERLHNDNEADPFLSFVEQLERAKVSAAYGDALGIGGIELVAAQLPHEPEWHSWLIMALAPIAALCAVGLMLAVAG